MNQVCYDRSNVNLQCNASVKIDWFHTIVNHVLIALNILLVFYLMHNFSLKASHYNSKSILRRQKRHLKNKLHSFVMFTSTGKINIKEFQFVLQFILEKGF